MDLLTQAVLGGALAAAVAPSRQRRLAAGIGALAGLLPDADALIHSDTDPLLVLDYHRHFTHALAFIPLGALLASLLLWPFVRRRLGFARLYLYALAGISCASLLDACTSYGTHLLLPFSNEKIAWNLVSVVDPLFTLLLLVPLLFSLRRPERATVRLGLLLAVAYLGLGYLQQQRVSEQVRALAAQRGHSPERLSVKPTLGNLLLWRSLYSHDGKIQADAHHAGLALRHYPGATAPLMHPGDFAPARTTDLSRFNHFADGWLVQPNPDFVGDARYAMLPTAIAPIWGLRWREDNRLEFVTVHAMTAAERRLWLAMLAGRDLPSAD